jgi:hypothetical protein
LRGFRLTAKSAARQSRSQIQATKPLAAKRHEKAQKSVQSFCAFRAFFAAKLPWEKSSLRARILHDGSAENAKSVGLVLCGPCALCGKNVF